MVANQIELAVVVLEVVFEGEHGDARQHGFHFGDHSFPERVPTEVRVVVTEFGLAPVFNSERRPTSSSGCLKSPDL